MPTPEPKAANKSSYKFDLCHLTKSRRRRRVVTNVFRDSELSPKIGRGKANSIKHFIAAKWRKPILTSCQINFYTKYILYIALMSANIVAIRKIEKTLRPLSHQEVLLIFCQYRCRYRFHSRSSPHNMLENIAGGYRLSCRNIYSIDNFNAIWCANYPRAICLVCILPNRDRTL